MLCHSCRDEKFTKLTAQHFTYIQARNNQKRSYFAMLTIDSGLNRLGENGDLSMCYKQ